jgi:integrase
VLKYFDATEPDNQMASIFTIGIDLGIRLGNILSMDAAWIDFANRFITIPYASAKGGETMTVVIWSDRVLEILKYRAAYHQHPASGQIFDFSHDMVGKRMRACKESLGYANNDSFKFHATRHTAASRYFQKRVPFKYVKDQLGHRSYKTTEIYAHLQPVDRLDAMQELMGQSPE